MPRVYKHTKKQWIKWYNEKKKLLEQTYEEVSPKTFYRELFPIGSFQTRGDTSNDKGNGMVDIIYDYQNGDDIKHYCKKYVLTDELDGLNYALNEDKTNSKSRLCLCSPVSYYGKKKTNDMAHQLFAIVLDIDFVDVQRLKNMIKQIGNGARTIPPNYLVSSGKGMHLYYFFKEPIPCYKYMIDQLTKFKFKMQDFTWNETTSLTPDKADHGACTQAFRMVGTETKLGKEYIVRAYKVNDHRWTIDELYNWIDSRLDTFLKDVPMPNLREPIEVYRKNHPLTLEQAKKKYPDWDPNDTEKKKKWTCKRELYDWWIKQIKTKAVVGGRYYAVLALAAYGSKCDIPLEEIREDAMKLLPDLENLTNDETNHFTLNDIEDALRFYKSNKQEVTYRLTRERIKELSKIDIPKNKRNGRKQALHLKGARAIQAINDESNGTNWRDGNGRKPKQEIVQNWKKNNPQGKPKECITETGLSKNTVYKWWNF